MEVGKKKKKNKTRKLNTVETGQYLRSTNGGK